MWETLLLVVLAAGNGLELRVLDWETGPPVDKFKPTDPVVVLADEGILDGTDSPLDTAVSSGCNSDEEDEGTRVPTDEPTKCGATGTSVREEADGL